MPGAVKLNFCVWRIESAEEFAIFMVLIAEPPLHIFVSQVIFLEVGYILFSQRNSSSIAEDGRVDISIECSDLGK
jgi:hypothetical protein